MGTKRRRTAADYEAAADDYARHPIRADEVGPIEIGPGPRPGGARLTDSDYAEMTADYAANPITVDEVIEAISINPQHLSGTPRSEVRERPS